MEGGVGIEKVGVGEDSVREDSVGIRKDGVTIGQNNVGKEDVGKDDIGKEDVGKDSNEVEKDGMSSSSSDGWGNSEPNRVLNIELNGTSTRGNASPPPRGGV